MVETVNCIHDWKNDPMFEDGVVEMITNIDHDLGKEMRQYCALCGKIRYAYVQEYQGK